MEKEERIKKVNTAKERRRLIRSKYCRETRRSCLCARSILCIFLLFLCPITAARLLPANTSVAHVEALLRQGKFTEALPLLLQIHQTQPASAKTCLQLGIVYTQLQQLEKAVEFYRKALKIDPSFLPARKNLGTVLWFLNQKENSVQEFLSLLKVLPNDPVPHFYLGTWEWEHKQFAKAKRSFEKAGDLAFNNPEALPMVLESYLATQDLSVTNRLMKQLEEAKNPNPDLVLRFATLFSQYQVYDQSIRALEKLVSLNLAKPEVYLSLGEAYDKQGTPEKAYAAYSKAIELAPKSEEGYLVLSSFASAHHNNEFALRILNQGLQEIPASARLLLQRGIIWALERNLGQAEASFLQAAEADRQWGLPRLALGIAQLQAGKLVEAASTFREAARKDAKDDRAEYLYALALIRGGAQADETRREEVTSALRKAIILNPDDTESRVSLGQTYLAADRVDLAVPELEKALQLDPKHLTATYQLAIAYRRQGKIAAAQGLLRSFKEIEAKVVEEEKEERKALVQILKTVKDR